MTESVYRVIQVVGSSPTSFEEATTHAIETAGKSLRDLRIAEIDRFDVRIENGKVADFRVRLNLSFKYQD